VPAAVEERIRNFILREFLPGEDARELTAATPLITTGVLDSIAALKLALFLEEEFRIRLAAHEVAADHLDTIERMVALVRSKG